MATVGPDQAELDSYVDLGESTMGGSVAGVKPMYSFAAWGAPFGNWRSYAARGRANIKGWLAELVAGGDS